MTAKYYDQTSADVLKLRSADWKRMTVAEMEAAMTVGMTETSIMDMIKKHVHDGTAWETIAETSGIHVTADPKLLEVPVNESIEDEEKRLKKIEDNLRAKRLDALMKMRDSDLWWKAAKELMSWRYAAAGKEAFQQGLVEHGVIDPTKVPSAMKTMGVTHGRKSIYLTAPK